MPQKANKEGTFMTSLCRSQRMFDLQTHSLFSASNHTSMSGLFRTSKLTQGDAVIQGKRR